MKNKTHKGIVVAVPFPRNVGLITFNKDYPVIYKNTVCKLLDWWSNSEMLTIARYNRVLDVDPTEVTVLYVVKGKKHVMLNPYERKYNFNQFVIDLNLVEKEVEFEVENICVYRQDAFGCSKYDRYVDFANITSEHD